ncbi:hypothetical protein XPA_007532 [Xanthoria parietina]
MFSTTDTLDGQGLQVCHGNDNVDGDIPSESVNMSDGATVEALQARNKGVTNASLTLQHLAFQLQRCLQSQS